VTLRFFAKSPRNATVLLPWGTAPVTQTNGEVGPVSRGKNGGAGRARTDDDQIMGSLNQPAQSLMHPHLTNRLMSTSSGRA